MVLMKARPAAKFTFAAARATTAGHTADVQGRLKFGKAPYLRTLKTLKTRF
jgi:hypothetical protein